LKTVLSTVAWAHSRRLYEQIEVLGKGGGGKNLLLFTGYAKDVLPFA
jgi:hypothetical protein